MNAACARLLLGRVRLALLAALLAASAALTLAPRAQSASTTGDATAPKPATTGTAKPLASASLEECTTSEQESERAATFAGEMSWIPGTTKMEMRIDVLERAPAETSFHLITAGALGSWRTAAPSVKSYRYLKQITNLTAPAYYRGAVRFRWLGAKGKLIKAMELRTARCLQTLVGAEAPPAGGEGSPKTS